MEVFERIRKSGLIGRGVSMRVAFEVSEAHPRSQSLLPKGQDVALSYFSHAMPAFVLPCSFP